MSTDTILSFEEAMEKYDPVLGFEVHVELNTKTKMFSSAPNVFGDEPNTNVNEVDLGMPGVLPVVMGEGCKLVSYLIADSNDPRNLVFPFYTIPDHEPPATVTSPERRPSISSSSK